MAGRSAVIGTFLALLEMARLRLVRVFQDREEGQAPGEIVVEARETLGDGAPGADGVEEYR